MSNVFQPKPVNGPRGGCTLLIGLFVVVMALISFFSLMIVIPDPVFGMGAQFGTFSPEYLQRREWRKMCEGSARYQAMQQAYDARKPDPCNPKAKRWVK